VRKLEYVIKRSASAVFVLLGVSLVTFVMTRVVPSNPAALYLGPRARAEDIARVTEEMGLNEPVWSQYATYLGQLLRGDWGISIATRRPVLEELFGRLPATLELLLVGMAIATIGGIAIGAFSARWRGRPADLAARSFSLIGVSLPAFWLGMLLQILFFRHLGWFPLSGRIDPDLRFIDPVDPVTGFLLIDSVLGGNWTALQSASWHLILPALTLAAFPMGLIARMTRATMLETLEQDFIRTSTAYGLSERSIVYRYALKNSLGPTVSILGLSLAYALTGSFFVEVIFNWPGLGMFTVRSLLNLDHPAILGVTLLGAVTYIAINMVVDLVNAWIDPRISLETV
jgi:ABC-type dipeptide/oligopeptide/nickel transport system permease component